MELDLNNVIDKKISEYFSEDIIQNFTKRKAEFFGINILSNPKADFCFKCYYDYDYSFEKYQEHNNVPLIEYLKQKGAISTLSLVHDRLNQGCTRFDIRLMDRNNDNMRATFEWLRKNVSFWRKYEKDILKISEMKSIHNPNYKYASLYYLGFIYKFNNIDSLNCHWLCKSDFEEYNDEYYLNYFKELGSDELIELSEMGRDALRKCGGHILVLGMNYNATCIDKYKIYLINLDLQYGNLMRAYSEYPAITYKLKTVREWNNNIHPELKLVGFAVGKNKNKETTLNLYYQF